MKYGGMRMHTTGENIQNEIGAKRVGQKGQGEREEKESKSEMMSEQSSHIGILTWLQSSQLF